MTQHETNGLRALLGQGSSPPRVALVLGSGLGQFGQRLQNTRTLPYAQVPSMPGTGVAGHAGNFLLGSLDGVSVVAMQGRAHLYEGHPPAAVVQGVRLMLELGVKALIVTNAAGGIRSDLQAGQLMLIEDHLNLTGTSALLGPNDEALGPRFVDMSHAYDPALRSLAMACAERTGVELKQGVYAGLLGPAYETPAEVRMLGGLGADAVGMSTVLEVMAARHMGVPCLGISCITNVAAGLSDAALDHDDVQAVASGVSERFGRLVSAVIGELGRG